jgi:hypothetical protein
MYKRRREIGDRTLLCERNIAEDRVWTAISTPNRSALDNCVAGARIPRTHKP